MDMSLSKLWKMVKNREIWCAPVHGVTKSQIQLIDYTTNTPKEKKKKKKKKKKAWRSVKDKLPK